MIIERIVFMNAPILTGEGTWTYRRLADAEHAKVFLSENEWNLDGVRAIATLSAVGHESTAQAMTELLETKVEVNQINYQAEPGDACLVMKLRGRITEGQVLDRAQLDEIGYDFFVMEYALPIDLGGPEENWLPKVRGLVYHVTSVHAGRYCGGTDHLGYHRAIMQAFGIGLGPESQIGYDAALKVGWSTVAEALKATSDGEPPEPGDDNWHGSMSEGVPEEED